MKITICYEDGHTPCSSGCRVYGFASSAMETVRPGWIVYSIYELPDTPQLSLALIDALKKFEVDYSDTSFASIVPESACVVSGLIDMLLARSDFANMPYTSLTRKWRDDKWTEIKRRIVSDKDYDRELQSGGKPATGLGMRR